MTRSIAIEQNHVATGAELHFRVFLWIASNPCSALKDASAALSEHFSVSRSTAYRWLQDYRAAMGMS